jgi:hypothetical protein
MATALYDTGRNAFLVGAVNFTSGNMSASLVHTSATGTPYTPVLTADQFYSIIPAGAVIAGPVALPTPTASAGIANCGNVVFSAVASGTGTTRQVDGIVIFNNTGTTTTSQLVAFIDNASGLPVNPNGSNITLNIDTGVNKLFKL